MVQIIISENRNWGYVMIAGYLASKGYKIQRYRIRESVLRLDPDGVEERKRCALHRRVYSVPCPNALWHIDGHHKLIRYSCTVLSNQVFFIKLNFLDGDLLYMVG